MAVERESRVFWGPCALGDSPAPPRSRTRSARAVAVPQDGQEAAQRAATPVRWFHGPTALPSLWPRALVSEVTWHRARGGRSLARGSSARVLSWKKQRPWPGGPGPAIHQLCGLGHPLTPLCLMSSPVTWWRGRRGSWHIQSTERGPDPAGCQEVAPHLILETLAQKGAVACPRSHS